MLDIIIVGAGGFGREIFNFYFDSFDKKKFRLKGFIDDDANQLNNYSIDYTILSNIDDYVIQDSDRFIVGIGNIEIKKNIVEKLKERGARFVNLIHPTAYVAPSTRLGEGVVLCPFTTVSDCGHIGDFVMMHIYASCGHDTKIGRYGILSPYATVNGFCHLEDEVFMGTHSTVTAYRNIGQRSKISANSVATTNIPPQSIVFGVPGKHKTIFF